MLGNNAMPSSAPAAAAAPDAPAERSGLATGATPGKADTLAFTATAASPSAPTAAPIASNSPTAAGRLEAVLARYERPLLGFAMVRCGDHGMAQDAVQETLLRFLRNRPAGEVESLAPWLFTTCRNILTDLRRKSSRSPLILESQSGDPAGDPNFPASGTAPARDPVSPESTPDEALAQKETARALHRLITALPANQQEVVRLKFETGLAYRDIAAATGLSVANVGWLLHQAVSTLRQDWRQLELLDSGPGQNPSPVLPAGC